MKVNRNWNRHRSTGFTLVELVIVLTIIVVLAGSGIYYVTGLVDDAKAQRVDSDLKALDVVLKSYERNNNGRPPTQELGLNALVERPEGVKRWRQYLEEEMLDPWGVPYQYRYPSQKSKKRYDIWSFGEDGVESEDDLGNW